jgi:glycosyltransferase involved in cell wall biosynthesis
LTGVTRVVTLSEYSKRRLLHHVGLAPGDVAVVPPGVAPVPASSAHVPITGRFMLYPARDWAHKRHPFLLAVMDEVWKASPDVTLVLTGWHDGSPAAEPSTRRRRGRVVNLGYIPENELQALYERAEALLFPSSFEGFGLPVLEAMAAGCPVVCSGLEVLRELVADAALVPPADEPKAWARAITEELPARRASLRSSGRSRALDFSRERMRRGWGEQLRAAGFRVGGSSPRAAAVVPLTAVQAELTRWTDVACHADARLAVIAGLEKTAAERLAVIEDLRRSGQPPRTAEPLARLIRGLARRMRGA